MANQLGHRGDRGRRWAGRCRVDLEYFGMEGIAGRIDRRNARDHEPAHVLEADHVLGRVAAMGAGLMPGRAQAVAPIPRSQGGRCHPEAPSHGRHREARGNVR